MASRTTTTTSFHDRLALVESALQNLETLHIPDSPGVRTPARHSIDHRFDKTDPEVDAAPVPTPAQEKKNPFDTLDKLDNAAPAEKQQFYDSIASKFGLGIRDEGSFSEFVVYNAFVTNLRVCPVHLTDTGRYYYIEHRFWLPNTPGVVLRQGTDKEGKIFGVANIPLQGRNSYGVGDFKNRPHDMVWEHLRTTGFWTHMRYEFEHEMPSGERKVFHWIRTRNNIIDDQGDLVLIEKDKESDILAEYLGKGLLKWKKRGRLRIKHMEQYGDSWEHVVLLTWSSVIELSRRRARVRRYSPTHIIHG